MAFLFTPRQREDIEDTVKAVAAYINSDIKRFAAERYTWIGEHLRVGAAKCTMSQRKRRAPGKRLELRTLP